MFVFGTLALEQFVDRLIEWPQYCNHILQISHLRGTHSELVAFIEQALARISSGHSDTDGGSHASLVNQHGSTHSASGNLEVNSEVCHLNMVMRLKLQKTQFKSRLPDHNHNLQDYFLDIVRNPFKLGKWIV